MAALILKVNVLHLGVTKTFQLDTTERVEYVITQVQEKVAGTQPHSNQNFGLFFKDPSNEKKSYWLLNSRPLRMYDLANGTELLYKDKNRYLKVKMLDGTIKTVLVNDSKSVGHALDLICEKIGITNADEYSLFIEQEKDDVMDEEEAEEARRGTLRKMSHAIMHKVDDYEMKKVQTLKRKAHTDDDTYWLANQKTLREAGVHDDTLVVIRRRFTVEQSVNITNPIEINLLYVQSRDAILDGSHPCTMEQAAKFAAFQIQVTHGDFDDSRYKSGFVDVKECLPKEYHKSKEIVKKIKEEHRILERMPELEAKYKYIQLCQNLPTYGVTFFVVKEKMVGKNKLIPRLLGVNKESVMRVDERSKCVLKVWPLTTIKNWASSPNSFTLDFGGYTEGMVSVQTLEGPQIGQLIGGYIDILMSRINKIKYTHARDDELGMVEESSTVPNKSRFIQNRKFKHGDEMMPQYGKLGHVSGSLSKGQRALLGNLDASGKAVLVIYDELNDEENPYAILEPFQKEQDSDNFSVDKSMGDIYASVASIISNTNKPSEDDYTTVGAGVSTIASNLKDLSRHLKMRAAGMKGDDGNDLLDAAKKLADAFNGLMVAISPTEDKSRDDILIAANDMSEAGVCIEHILNERQPNGHQGNVLSLAKVIEKAANVLSQKAAQLAGTLDEPSARKINASAEKARVRASELVTCAKILGLYMDNPAAKQQMLNAIKSVGQDINALTGLCLVATNDEDLIGKIQAVAQAVTDALNNLLEKVQFGSDDSEKAAEKNVYEMILDANDALFRSLGNGDEMVRQATILGQATSQLIKGLKTHANDIDDVNEKDRLLAAAKLLTDATSALLLAAKKVKDNPTSKDEQEGLKTSAVLLRLNTNSATKNALKKTLIIKLNSDAKNAVAASTHVVSSARSAAPYNTNPVAQQQFNESSAELLSQHAKDLMHAVKDWEGKVGNPTSQLNLITSAKFFLPLASRMVALSKAIIPTVTQNAVSLQLAEASMNAEKALNDLKQSAEKAAEGQEECDRAINAINKAINDLDQAALAALSDNLKPLKTDSIKGLEGKILDTCIRLKEEIPDTVEYAQSVPEMIGHSVIKLAELIEPLAEHSIGFAANLSTASQKQTEILDLAKTVFESASQLVSATKDAGGNPTALKHHQAVDESSDNLLEALKDIMAFVKGTTGDIDTITYLVSSIDNAKDTFTAGKESEMPPSRKSYIEYQDNMIKKLKAIARDSHEVVGKVQSNPKEISSVCEDIFLNYSELVGDTQYAVILLNPQVGDELKANIQTLGDGCKHLVLCAGHCQSSPDDQYIKKDLTEKAKDVSLQVARIMTDLQKGSVGTKACVDALTMLSGLIGDIDTNMMFAETGTLNPDDGSKFNAHRDVILLNSQQFVKETKSLVNAVHGSQDQMAASVREVLNSTTKLIDSVKLGAASIGSEDMDGQMLLLNAAKNVASALSDLMHATKNTCGKSKDDPSSDELKIFAKHLVGNLTSLLKTVRSVEDKASRGSRAIESSIEAIKHATLNSQPESGEKTATPEELILSTKGVTLATGKAVAAGNSLRQADIIEAANIGRKHCTEMFEIAKAAINTTESDSIRNAVIAKVRGASQAYCDVLNHVSVVISAPSVEEKQKFHALSKRVAYSVGEVVKTAELLKGNELVNPDDPNVIAENELLGAAASIEAAAKKLAELKPKARPKQADETLDFEEQILEAAKSITAAAGALVKAATFAQRELVAQGLVCSPTTDHYADTQWSQGLISAARLVADATGSLCEAANAAVLGDASQEKLIASAQAVSASTTQLLVACRVKADKFSKTQKGLQGAGAAVKRATDTLVKAAEDAAVFDVDDTDGYVPSGGVKTGRLIDEMNAQVEILRREKELEKARKKLEQIRLAGYKNGRNDSE